MSILSQTDRRNKRQLRCIICGRLINRIKDHPREFCSNCLQKYQVAKKRKWAIGLSKKEIITHLKEYNRMKKRKEKR